MKASDFDIEPDLGAADPERSLGEIIYLHYKQQLGTRSAVEMTKRYINKMVEGA